MDEASKLWIGEWYLNTFRGKDVRFLLVNGAQSYARQTSLPSLSGKLKVVTCQESEIIAAGVDLLKLVRPNMQHSLVPTPKTLHGFISWCWADGKRCILRSSCPRQLKRRW